MIVDLAKAHRALKSAHLLLSEGDHDGACNRAYYSMFEAAKFAINRANVPVKAEQIRTHGGLITAFGLHLVKNGIMPLDQGKSLNRVEELRLIADYRGESLSPAEARMAIDMAEAFMHAIEERFA